MTILTDVSRCAVKTFHPFIMQHQIINWVRQAALALPNAPEAEEIPEITQVDELETFVGKKKQNLAVDSSE